MFYIVDVTCNAIVTPHTCNNRCDKHTPRPPHKRTHLPLPPPIRAERVVSEAAAGRVFVLPAFETLPRLGLDRGVHVAEKAAAGESDFGSGSESDLDECLSHLIGSSLDRPPHRLTMTSPPALPLPRAP